MATPVGLSKGSRRLGERRRRMRRTTGLSLATSTPPSSRLAAAAVPAGTSARRPQSKSLVMVIMLVLCLSALGGGCSASSDGQDGPSPSSAGSTSTGPADIPSPTSTNKLVPGGSIKNTSGVATFVNGEVWLPIGSELSRVDTEGNLVSTDTNLVRIDPATGDETARVPLSGTGTYTFALGDDIVVKTSTGVDVISTTTLQRERTLPAGRILGFGSIWDIGGDATGRRGVDDNTTLLRIDPTSGKTTGRVVVQDDSVEEGHEWNPDPQLTVGAGSIWVGIGKTRSVLRLDPTTLRPQAAGIKLDVVEDDVIVGFGFGSVWAHQGLSGAGKLYRIDPATNRVTGTVELGDPTLGSTGAAGAILAIGEDSIWTCDSSGTITQVDPGNLTAKKIQKLPIDDCTWLTAGANSIWISNSHNSMQPMTFRLDL